MFNRREKEDDVIGKLGVVVCLVEDNGGVGSRKEALRGRLDFGGGASHAVGVLGLGSLLELTNGGLRSRHVLPREGAVSVRVSVEGED